MPNLASLRDRTALTRLLILRELRERPRGSLTEVATALGVTVQAVSAHVKHLHREGLLARDDGVYLPTERGLAALTEGFRDLKHAVDEAVHAMAEIRVASARADGAVAQGESVGLFMVQGELVARARAKSASTGRAVADARSGEEVIVTDLRGVVELAPGALRIVRVPSPAEGGSAAADAQALAAALASRAPAVAAAHGTGARVLAKAALGREPEIVYAPVEAAFNAAELGLDVVLFTSGDLLRDDLNVLDALNARTLRRVPIQLLEAPRRAARAR